MYSIDDLAIPSRHDAWWRGAAIFTMLVMALALPSCHGSGNGSARRTSSTSPGSSPSTAPSASSSLESISELCPGQTIGLKARTLMFRTPDGISLYGAVFGSGHAGAVLANDVPHQICEEVPAAAWFAQRGLRTIVFDYRGHGESEIGSDPGRLDLDVAGAAAELRRLGVARVLLVGSYAGVAATVVASTEISPAVEGVIGFSPAPSRGQYVNGPFDPIGALQAAPRMRPPALYVTVRGDQYVPVAEVERLYRATGSREKRLVVVGYGPASWDLLDFSPFMRRVDRLVEGFIRAHG